jgi:poly(3-hydroxybutyrate) depolymerase
LTYVERCVTREQGRVYDGNHPTTTTSGGRPSAGSVMKVIGRSIDVGGATRVFGLAEPAGEVAAVLLSLHGTRSSWPRHARLSGMARLADAGAVVAFPEAVLRIGSGTSGTTREICPSSSSW